MRRFLRVTLYFLIGFYLIFAYVAIFLSEQMIFYPQPSSYRDDATITKLTTADGKKVSAIYLLNPDAKFTILYSHGNAEDIGDLRPLFQRLHDEGFAVFGYDYEGYGTSEGKPTEKGTYRDIDAAYAYLTHQEKIPPSRILVFGRSVGAGPAVDLASREPVGGLIVQSGFTSAFRVLIPVPLIPFDRYSNLKKIGNVHCPVLVMHGRSDEVIAFKHGERLFAAAPAPKSHLWVENAGHNDFEAAAGKSYFDALHAFADSLPTSARSAPLR